MRGCPVCEAPVAERSANPSFPFCSDRCKWVDLGRWVNEEYVISEPLGAEDENADDGLDLDERVVH